MHHNVVGTQWGCQRRYLSPGSRDAAEAVAREGSVRLHAHTHPKRTQANKQLTVNLPLLTKYFHISDCPAFGKRQQILILRDSGFSIYDEDLVRSGVFSSRGIFMRF